MKSKEYLIAPENIDILSEPSLDGLFPKEEIETQEGELKVLSLFSGCGGMDIGLEGGFICHRKSVTDVNHIAEYITDGWIKVNPTRFKTVFACDILAEARIAWVNYMRNRNVPPSVYHLKSIVDLVDLHKSGVEVFPKEVDIVTGGFPCQDFSVAGKRKGFNSPVSHKGEKGKEVEETKTRGKLYYWMKEVIEITRPKMFIAENVKGIMSLGDVKDIIQKDFSEAGGDGYYVLDPRVLHAADYGVPESRERVIFIGVRKDALREDLKHYIEKTGTLPEELNPYPLPSHSKDGVRGLADYVTCEDVLQQLEEPENSVDPTHHFYSKAKYLNNGSQGQTEINYKGIGPTIRAEHHGNIEFRRLFLENGGKITQELSRGLTQRRLSPRECAMIQTFPPDYNFVLYNYNGKNFSVSPSMAYKIIGNAVPPVLAYKIALRIESLWDSYFN